MGDSQRDSGWAEHEREQRRAWLRLTPRQRLDWLWEARLFALRAEEARRKRGMAGREGAPKPTSEKPGS
jgi:hypothetical protein